MRHVLTPPAAGEDVWHIGRRAIILALAVALCATPAASANTSELARRTDIALRLAHGKFGSLDCHPAVVWRILPRDRGGEAILDGGREPLASMPDTCEVRLNVRYVTGMAWPPFCTIIVHEYGHLAGHGHGRGVMAAVTGPWPPCSYAALRRPAPGQFDL